MKKHYSYFPYFGTAGELTPTEEEAATWLLQLPQLLDWPHEIYWLWPELDQRNYVARLWGVDSSGTLIIVEIRRDRDLPDPYEGFVFEIKSGWMDHDWTAQVLLKKWRKYWTAQSCVPANAPKIVKALRKRARVGNPHPVLIGVIASTQKGFRLSSKARKSFEWLQKRVGHERVRLSVVRGTFGGERGLRVECITFDETDQVVPPRKPCASAPPGRRRSRRSPCSKRSREWRYGLRFVVQN